MFGIEIRAKLTELILTNNLKLKLMTVFVCLLLVVAFLLRLRYFAYIFGGDIERDYLIAQHIIKFGEFPLSGPWNGILGALRNSPLYFYLIAFFVFIVRDIENLWLVNAFLQTLTILLVYLTSKKIFGEKVAIFSSSLLAFSLIAMIQSAVPLMPTFMFFFINLCYLFLVKGYLEKSYKYLLLSVFLLAFSIAVHISVLGIVPGFFAISILALSRDFKNYIYKFFGLIFAFLVSLIFLWAPLIKYCIFHAECFNPRSPSGPLIVTSFESFFQNLSGFFHSLLGLFFLPPFGSNMGNLEKILFAVIVFSFFAYILRKNVPAKDKVPVVLIALFIFQPGFLVSLVSAKLQVYYIYSIFSLVLILYSKLFVEMIPKGRVFIPLYVFAIATAVWASSNYLHFFQKKSYFIETKMEVEEAVYAVESSVLEIRSEKNIEGFEFFQVIFYNENGENVFEAYVLWELEKNFNVKLTKVADEDASNYLQLGSDEYIYLVCGSLGKMEQCKNNFSAEYKKYKPVKSIYAGSKYSVLLMKKDEAV